MDPRYRKVSAVGLLVAVFLLVQLGGLALATPFVESGRQQVEDPSDPTNSAVYLLFILVATALMLAAFKYELDWIVRGFVVFASGLLAWYVFSEFVAPIPALVGGLALAGALLVYPEWYVLDAAGVVMGAGAAGLFGISFGILPAIILLSVLAVYDAISVYGTEHMLTLAEGVMDLKIPVVLVIPTTLSFSYLDDPEQPESLADDESEATATEGEDGTEESATANGEETDAAGDPTAEEGIRDALFVGLGDAVMPSIVVVSAAYFLSVEGSVPTYDVPYVLLNLPALTAMIGTTLGLLALMWLVLKGRAHAGLPLLNGGAIGGYLLGALASGLTLAEAFGVNAVSLPF